MITTLLAPTSARPRLTISSSTCSSAISPPIATATSRVASRPRNALSASSRRRSLRLVQLGVVDRDRRPVGEDHGGLLVLLGELAVGLLGQVQVAPRLPADHDRHTQEAAHHRMPRGKPVAARVLANIGQAQRLWMLDQRAEHPSSARQIADRPVGLLVDSRGQELLELGALLVQDPQRRVARPGDLPRGLKHTVQHDPRSSSVVSARPTSSRRRIHGSSEMPPSASELSRTRPADRPCTSAENPDCALLGGAALRSFPLNTAAFLGWQRVRRGVVSEP